MLSARSLLPLWLAACAAGDDTDKQQQETATPECDTELVGWEPFADGYLKTWCTPCHASEIEGMDRAGAPAGVDFDTWAGAAFWADRIGAASVDQTMPPGGGPSEEDRARIAEWAACGAPGSDPEPSDCEVPRLHEGDVLVDDAFDAAAFCASANTIVGKLTVAADTTGLLEQCLCVVQGDVEVLAGAREISLQVLNEMGALDVANTDAERVSLPSLTTLDGALTLTGNPALLELQVPALATLGGAVTVTDNAVLDLLALPNLTSATSLTVTGNAGMRAVTVSRLESVAGSVTVSQNPTLEEVLGTEIITSIGGDLRVTENVNLIDLDKFTRLTSVGGEVEIRENLALTSVHGFYALESVDGPVRIQDNPELGAVMGFAALERAGGLVVHNNDTMEFIGLFQSLSSVDGDLTIQDNARILRLDSLPLLQSVSGDVVVSGNPFLGTVTGLGQLETVGGTLSFEGERLQRIGGLEMLTEVAGTLNLEDLPDLIEIDGYDELIEVGGVRMVNTALVGLADLSDLRLVRGDLLVRNNDMLTSVSGLGHLQLVEGSFTIRLNDILPQDEVDELVEILGSDVLLGDVNTTPNGD